MRSRLYLSLIAVLVSSALADGGRFFDFGTADSEVYPGFERVTPQHVYRAETGFGWENPTRIKTHYRHYSREWAFNASRGRKQPPPIYSNAITADTVYSDAANVFRIDVPPGQYEVYLLAGLSAGNRRHLHRWSVAVGNRQAHVTIPGPYRFESRTLVATADKGAIRVRMQPMTDWLLSALVVSPAAQAQSIHEQVIDPLEKAVFFLPPDVARDWVREAPPPQPPAPEFDAAARKRGFALSARHWSEVVYPYTVPRSHELNPALEIFATPGEYEPVTFTLVPLREVADIQVSAGPLRGPGGEIPSERIGIRWVRYMPARPNYSVFQRYREVPDVLMPNRPLGLETGRNLRFWLTVRVPENAKPGLYRGDVRIRAAGSVEASVPFALRVLPFRLEKNPEHLYGMYYRDPLSRMHSSNPERTNAYWQRKAKLERLDMVEHGMNTHISSVSGLTRDSAGNWTIDGDETDRRIALDRRHGMADHPLVTSFSVTYWYSRLVDKQGTGSHLRLVQKEVPESFFTEVTRMVKAIETERKRRGWPEFLYYPVDEPGRHDAAVRFMVGVLKAIKRVPGVRTYVTADPTHEAFEPMMPHVDVWCCQPFVHDRETILRMSRKRGVEFWCYPNHVSGENDHTPIRGARMTFGFGFWQSGFRALIPWIYQYDNGDPWNYLDGTTSDFFNRATPEGDPIPVIMWEAYREGIDDGRYLYTLECLIEKSKRKDGRGPKALDFIRSSFDVQEKYKYDDLWSGRDFDAFRWLLAQKIMELQ